MSLREYTVDELKREGSGEDEGVILVAISGKVYDVSTGRQHYGAGGPYHTLAGRDITRAMCKFELTPSDEWLDVNTLTPAERECLHNWEQLYDEKYPCVGKLIQPHIPDTKKTLCTASHLCSYL